MKVFDLHCDTLSELRRAEMRGDGQTFARNNGHIDLEKLEKGDYMLQCFAAFVNLADPTPGADPLVTALEEIDVFKRMMERYSDRIAPVYRPEDIRKNAEAGKISGMLTIEEAGCCKGSLGVLRRMYPTMKKYVNACRFWCGFGFGKHRYLWEMPGTLGFGDWVAPDVPQMSQWQGRIKWTGTASLCNTSALLAKIADILGETQDAKHYRALSEKTADAYCSLLTDGNGKLLEEFQTAYVLPIYLNMFPTQQIREKAAANLAALAKRNDWCIGTGFPGTPYILFALCDNGQVDAAYHMLLNTKCPSWLYEVKAGATTIWERWDGLDENGVCPIGDDGTDKMISYNHYASGAVGDFLYRRIAGIEPTEAGYKTFRVKPILGGGLTSAAAKVRTPYGDASVQWKTAENTFTVTVCVPVGTRCELTLPDGTSQILASGTHTATCSIR